MLKDLSDILEFEGIGSILEIEFESYCTGILARPWDHEIDHNLLGNIGKFRSYNFNSVKDLIRMIRNKHNHLNELPN